MSTDAPAVSTVNVQIAQSHLIAAAAVITSCLVVNKVLRPALARRKAKQAEETTAPQA